MWNKISRLFGKTNSDLNNETVVDDSTMDREGDRRRMTTHDLESQDTYDTRQSKQRASVKWLLSKSYNNKVPENLREPFYRDHEDQEHLKPQIIHKLANAELYCLGLANIYSDPNYHNLNHSQIIQTLIRKGVFVVEPPDAQLTETVLIQTTPLKLSAHMAVIEAMMVLYAKEVVTPDGAVAAIQRFTQSLQREALPLDHEDAMLLWINKACSALRKKIEQELITLDEQGGGERLQPPALPPVRELQDLCNGVGLAALVSFYCPDELPWPSLVTAYLPTISDSVHNVQLVRDFCERSLPSSPFHVTPEDITYMRGSMIQNLVVFLADLFNVLEIHPAKCVRFPGSDRSLQREVSVSKSCPVQTSLPVKRSTSHPSGDVDRSYEQDEQFVVHRGRGVPTLSSVVQASDEPLVPARLRAAKEKHNTDSKADERGEPVAAGRPSHWDDSKRPTYAGRRSRRNSVTEDSQLTIENFGGSQEHLNFIGRNPDKELGAHTGRKSSAPPDCAAPATPLRTSAQEARSSGVELIFQDTNNLNSEKRDEEKSVKQVIHSKQERYGVDLDQKVTSSFAELSRLKDSATYKKSVHQVYMQYDQEEEESPPKTILNKKAVVNSNGSSEKKITSFATLPNNTTTWQQQSTSNQPVQSESTSGTDGDGLVMASQLLNVRMKLEDKRRKIESEKRRMEVVMNKQRQKVGKAAFLQAVSKKEISDDVTSVQHKWLDGGVPFVEERKTPDIENMDLETYQQSISQMNTSLHDIQSEIHRLASHQHRIDDQQTQIQGLVSRQQLHGLATAQQHQLQSLATQQQQINSLAAQQQQLQSLAAHALVRTQDGPPQFYLHDQPSQRRTWAQSSMQTLPHDLAYPHPADPRLTWAADPQSFNAQPQGGFVLAEQGHAAYVGAGGDARYQNGDNHGMPHHHSLGAVNQTPGPFNNAGGFQLHPDATSTPCGFSSDRGSSPGGYPSSKPPGDREPSPGGYSSKPFSDRGSSPGGYSSKPQSEGSRSPTASPQHRAPPVPPRQKYSRQTDSGATPTEKARPSSVIHAPMPTPPVDDMEPQSISFIGNPSNLDDPSSSLAQNLMGLQITSGSRTYRIPSPTRPAIARNSFKQEAMDAASATAVDEEDESDEKGFYISFDNDPQPLRPKPPLRTKRMSPKKERAVSQYDRPFLDEREEPKTATYRSSLFGERQDATGYSGGRTQEPSGFPEARSYGGRPAERPSYGDRTEPAEYIERQATRGGLQSRLDSPAQRVAEPRRSDVSSPGVGLVIGSELLNPEASTLDEMERKKERIMLLSLQRRQQQEELKQQKEQEAERKREREKYKQEERERKKEEERERRQAILEQYKLKKAIEEAEREGKVLPNKADFSTMKSAPKMRNKTGTRPRPKTIHVDSGGVDAVDSVLSPSRSKKGSTSNLADPAFNVGSRRDYYRGSQDNLADRMDQRRGGANSLFSRDSPDDGRGTSPSRSSGNNLGRRGSYKTSRGSSTDQDSMAYRYGDTDSGLGRATPPRRAPSPGMNSMRHLPSPSGPGSLPPGLMTKRRTFDDGASDISSNLSSMMDYTGPRLYKQPSSKSNRPIMLNAVEYCVFPGVVNREAKNRVLEEIARSESKHFLILFRDAGCQFRALYSFCPDREEVAKLYGTGPKQVFDRMFDRFFKYNSGGKCFSQIHTKHLTVTIDAFTIHNSLWQGKKVSMPIK